MLERMEKGGKSWRNIKLLAKHDVGIVSEV